jgi:hypothetical protein
MKMNRVYSVFAAILVLLAVSSACGIGTPAEPTAIPPTVTNTPIPTDTPTQLPTSTPTPKPTVTFTPTPAPVGIPVSGNAFEVTVLKARVLTSGVHTDDGYYWATDPGYLFVELGVRVRNLTPASKASVPWQYVYIVEDSGKSWYPNWGGFKAVSSGKALDPSSISVSPVKNGDDVISFDQDLYLRAIYVVSEKKPTTLEFGFDQSPMIQIIVNR